MLKTGNLIIGGISLDQYGAVVNSSGIYEKPKRDYEMVHIPGRNGDLHIDNGSWRNVDVTYTVVFPVNGESFTERYNRLFNALMVQTGYLRIEDDFDVDHFRMGILSDISSIKAGKSGGTGLCKIKLDCKPQRFLKSGATPISARLGDYYWTEKLIATPTIMPISDTVISHIPRLQVEHTYSQSVRLLVTAGGAGTIVIRLYRNDGTYIDQTVIFESAESDRPVFFAEDNNYIDDKEAFSIKSAREAPRAFSTDFQIRVDPEIASVGYTTDGSANTFNARVLSASFENVTAFASKPIYNVVGYGDIRIGDEVVRVNDSESLALTLDAETKNATYTETGEPANNKILGEIPDLPPGVTGILADETVTSLTITPRWYEI